ncbi:gluconokinase [Nitratireductor basaltis]|uniref:Gluconokinase n=1 Tax=Nitratireductor basaltis TaxID=472175 RepID=A0A084U5E5_9HYPH|nr:gluconokinase [Nitratireductor basaltis]KFB08181.1 Gluconokinase [Nitratireductor basaltis]
MPEQTSMTDRLENPALNGPRYIIFMGVCGVGKSTVAKAVADALPARFLEADGFHPRENVESMAAGRPLNDEQRWPWLSILCQAAVEEQAKTGMAVTIACSALKRRYRDFMREKLGGETLFIHLDADRDVIFERLTSRPGHFMPPALLDSQLADLEAPTGEAGCHRLDVSENRARVVERALVLCRQAEKAASGSAVQTEDS